MQNQNSQMQGLVGAVSALDTAESAVSNATVGQQVQSVKATDLEPLGDAVLTAQLALQSAQFFVVYNIKNAIGKGVKVLARICWLCCLQGTC